ncbi:MAG: ATP-dependent Clp protease proteolytic subunit [Alphaproteobacteria bacterium]
MAEKVFAEQRVHIFGDLGDEVKGRDVAAAIARVPARDPIGVIIDSAGGDVSDMREIIAAMDARRAPVITFAVGRANSAAAIILASGTKRYANDDAEIMVHQAAVQDIGQRRATADVLRTMSRTLDGTDEWIAARIARVTGKTKAEAMRMLERETYLTAASAKAMGLVTHIVERKREASPPAPQPRAGLVNPSRAAYRAMVMQRLDGRMIGMPTAVFHQMVEREVDRMVAGEGPTPIGRPHQMMPRYRGAIV